MRSCILRCQVRVDLPPSGCKLWARSWSRSNGAARYVCRRLPEVAVIRLGCCISLLYGGGGSEQEQAPRPAWHLMLSGRSSITVRVSRLVLGQGRCVNNAAAGVGTVSDGTRWGGNSSPVI